MAKKKRCSQNTRMVHMGYLGERTKTHQRTSFNEDDSLRNRGMEEKAAASVFVFVLCISTRGRKGESARVVVCAALPTQSALRDEHV